MSERRVEPDGPGEVGYTVGMTPSGLLLSITPDGAPPCLISRFAWERIIATVATIRAERLARAREDVRLAELLDDGE